jgi:hypothetical protein
MYQFFIFFESSFKREAVLGSYMNTENHWATFLRSRVVREYGFIGYHIHSSILSGLKSIAHLFMENTKWQIGNGNKINFWIHDWCGTPLSSLYTFLTKFS